MPSTSTPRRTRCWPRSTANSRANWDERCAEAAAAFVCACRPPRPILGPGSTPSPWRSISISRSRPSRAEEFSIAATGRDAERCARLEDNLILETYKKASARATGAPIVAAGDSHGERDSAGHGLRLLGSRPSGCHRPRQSLRRSSAGARTAFSKRPTRSKGHPDNVAACWLGGFVAAVCEGKRVHAAQVDPPARMAGDRCSAR